MNSASSHSELQTLLLDSSASAAECLRAGKLVAFPTETVYGLGADATNPAAVQRIFAAKGRPSDNPLIVHLHAVDAWPLAARNLTESARVFLNAFAPGPITVVLPKQAAICSAVTAGLDSVGIRIPRCPATLEMLALAARPIAAPSANRSGRPSCTTWQAVMEDQAGRIDAVLRGETSQLGIESTVVDCRGSVPVVLRPGGVSIAELQSLIPSTYLLAGQAGDSAGEQQPPHIPSPGVRHAHYQPRAQVHLFESSAELSGLTDFAGCRLAVATVGESEQHPWKPDTPILFRAFVNTAEYAHGFYEFLREADRLSADVILLQWAPPSGLGTALRDRQRRAAGCE